MRHLVLLMVLISSVGCTSDWIYNRYQDIKDPFTATFCVGPSATLGVKATGGIHFLLGGGTHRELGIYQGNWSVTDVASTGIPLIWATPNDYPGSCMILTRSDFEKTENLPDKHVCSGTHFIPFHQANPSAEVLRVADVEVTATFFVGFRLGFSVGQFFDFLAGFIGADPAGDDETYRSYDPDGGDSDYGPAK